MAMFNSYVKLPEGKSHPKNPGEKKRTAPGSRGGTGAAGARRTGRSGAGGGAGRGGTAAGARHLKEKPPVDQF